jgi:hypothetical protein
VAVVLADREPEAAGVADNSSIRRQVYEQGRAQMPGLFVAGTGFEFREQGLRLFH